MTMNPEQPQSPAPKKGEQKTAQEMYEYLKEIAEKFGIEDIDSLLRKPPAPKDKGVKRYDSQEFECLHYPPHTQNMMVESSDGEYVLWADHEAALKNNQKTISTITGMYIASCEEIKALESALKDEATAHIQTAAVLQGKIESLEAEVKRLGNLTIADTETFKIQKLHIESMQKCLDLEAQLKDKEEEINDLKHDKAYLSDCIELRIAELEQDRNYWKKSADDYSFRNRELNAQLKSAVKEIE
jgi:hypothetical protein